MLDVSRCNAKASTRRRYDLLDPDIGVILTVTERTAIFGAAFILERLHFFALAVLNNFSFDLCPGDKGSADVGSVAVFKEENLGDFKPVSRVRRT